MVIVTDLASFMYSLKPSESAAFQEEHVETAVVL